MNYISNISHVNLLIRNLKELSNKYRSINLELIDYYALNNFHTEASELDEERRFLHAEVKVALFKLNNNLRELNTTSALSVANPNDANYPKSVGQRVQNVDDFFNIPYMFEQNIGAMQENNNQSISRNNNAVSRSPVVNSNVNIAVLPVNNVNRAGVRIINNTNISRNNSEITDESFGKRS